MAYNGSIELISGIKQKNNGTFPLVDASAVQVTDEKRLDQALSEKISEPVNDGTSGQVLTTDGQGGRTWTTVQGGGGGSSLPSGGSTGDLLVKRTSTDYDAEWVAPANSPEQDNTRPITAAAVYTTVGNINALLATI